MMTGPKAGMNSLKTEHIRCRGLDLYRVIACTFVIINHCNSKVLLQLPPGSLSWIVSAGVVFVTKICVPVFFMITGYNLLHRSEDFGAYIRRIRRIAVCLAVFSLFYYLWRCITNTGIVDIPADDAVWNRTVAYAGGFLKVLISGGATDAFWYLYAYLGLLIAMPALQLLASALKPGRMLFIVTGLIWGYISLVPSVSVLIPDFAFSPDFQIPILTYAVFYLLLGHIFYLYRDKLQVGMGIGTGDVLLIIIYMAGLLLNACLAYTEYTFTNGASFLSYSEIHTVGMTIMSASAFILFLKLRGGKTTEFLVRYVSPLTFGIYLFADFVCSNTHMIYYNLCRYMNRLAAVTVQEIAAFICAILLTYIIRLIPGVRKWI